VFGTTHGKPARSNDEKEKGVTRKAERKRVRLGLGPNFFHKGWNAMPPDLPDRCEQTSEGSGITIDTKDTQESK